MSFLTMLLRSSQVMLLLLSMWFAVSASQPETHNKLRTTSGLSSSSTKPQICPDHCTRPRKVKPGITKFKANCIYNPGSTNLEGESCEGFFFPSFYADWFTYKAPNKHGCHATASVDAAFFGPYVYETPHTCPPRVSQCVNQSFPDISTVTWYAAPGKTYLLAVNPFDYSPRILNLTCIA